MQLGSQEISELEKKYKLNLINSISGIKPANLIGTISKEKKENVAIFSSVVHLGSDPAELGFIMRPASDPPRDTLENIFQTKYYTINHVPVSLTQKAHYTSAKLERGVSEFKKMKIQKEYLNDFTAPFVKNSPVKIGMKYQSHLELPNKCKLIIGKVVLIDIEEEAINSLGQVDLAQLDIAGISGLNTYYSLKKEHNFPYVRTNKIPDFKDE